MKIEDTEDKDISFKKSIRRARQILREIEKRNEELSREPAKETEQTRLV